MEVADDSIHFKPAQISAGGIAQWQSIRLQIERSPVQLRLPPAFFESRVHSNELLRLQNVLILTIKTRICVVYKEDTPQLPGLGYSVNVATLAQKLLLVAIACYIPFDCTTR